MSAGDNDFVIGETGVDQPAAHLRRTVRDKKMVAL